MKKKIYITLFLFVLINQALFSQYNKKIDSLEYLISKTNNVKYKVNYLYYLASLNLGVNNKRYKELAEKVLFYSNKHKYTKGVGMYYTLISSLDISKGEYQLAYDNSEKAIEKLKENKLYTSKLLEATYFNVVSLYYLGYEKKSILKAKSALQLAKSLKDTKQLATLNYFLGSCYSRNGSHYLSFIHLNNAIKYYKLSHNLFGLINCYNEIAVLNISEKNWLSAIEYSNNNLSLIKQNKVKDLQTMSLLYTTSASAFCGAKLYRQGLKYALLADRINKKFKNNEISVNNLNVLATIYFYLGQQDLSIKCCNLILKYPVVDEYKVEVFNLLAINYQSKKNYKLALYYQAKSIEIIESAGKYNSTSTEIYRNSYKDLAEIQNYLNDYSNAYKNLSKYVLLNNKVIDKEKKKDINELLIKFDTKEKNLKLKEFELQKRNKELAFNNQKNYLIFISSLLILSLIILFIVFVFYTRNNRKNKLILTQNIELEKFSKQLNDSLQEKSLLLKEIHHRVKNNLQIIMSLLNIQAKEGRNHSIQEFVTKTENRIQSMSLIHRSLYESESVDKIDFKKYIEQLVVHFENTQVYEEKIIKIDINIEAIFFDLITAIPVGLIVNELLSNAYKHAFVNRSEGVITISIQKLENKEYVMHFQDNGVGYDDIQSKNTLGLDLVVMLSKQLKGTFVKVTEKQGSHYKIHFKEHIK